MGIISTPHVKMKIPFAALLNKKGRLKEYINSKKKKDPCFILKMGFPDGANEPGVANEHACQCRKCKRRGFDP